MQSPAAKQPQVESLADQEISGPWRVAYSSITSWRKIGAGNFGNVYSAQYKGQHVAVKELLTDLDSEDSEEDGDMDIYYQREMATLKELQHENIVRLVGLCKYGEQIFIITEYIAGGDLRKRLKNPDIDVPWKLRVQMCIDMANSLIYLHSKNIIHRDFKSKNLLVADGWKLKACDFGFARKVTEEFMTLCGTDEWMAPEVMLGEPYDFSCDVYSFGMVMVEIITRKKPLERANPGMPYDMGKLAQMTPIDCPTELFEICVSCSQFYPENRPALLQVRERLTKLLEDMNAGKKVPVVGRSLAGMAVQPTFDDSEEWSSDEGEFLGQGSVINK